MDTSIKKVKQFIKDLDTYAEKNSTPGMKGKWVARTHFQHALANGTLEEYFMAGIQIKDIHPDNEFLHYCVEKEYIEETPHGGNSTESYLRITSKGHDLIVGNKRKVPKVIRWIIIIFIAALIGAFANDIYQYIKTIIK
jgi:hypothetical protein